MDNCIKMVSESADEFRVSNYIILFGGADVTGERFTPETKIDSSYVKSGMLYVDFEHGLDPDDTGMSEHDVLGYVDWKTAKTDDTGIFVERVLKRQARYVDTLRRMIEEGLIGTSSEAIEGKTAREGATITQWPLKRDSLTLTPAEPRMLSSNVLSDAKALYKAFPHSKSLCRVVSCHVKSQIEQAQNINDLESVLRDAGLSRSAAKAMLSRFKSLHQRDADPESDIPKDAVAKAVKSWGLKQALRHY